ESCLWDAAPPWSLNFPNESLPYLPDSHILRNLDPQNSRGPFELPAEKIRHPQKKDSLFPILLLNDRILVIKIVERLRELECIFRHVRRLPCNHGALQGGIRFGCRQQHLPKVLRLQLPRHCLRAQFSCEIGKLLAALLQLS